MTYWGQKMRRLADRANPIHRTDRPVEQGQTLPQPQVFGQPLKKPAV